MVVFSILNVAMLGDAWRCLAQSRTIPDEIVIINKFPTFDTENDASQMTASSKMRVRLSPSCYFLLVGLVTQLNIAKEVRSGSCQMDEGRGAPEIQGFDQVGVGLW